jgi:SAM-dependent methyltransferase
MQNLIVKLILSLNELFPITPVHMEIMRAKRTTQDYHFWEYTEIKRVYKEFEPYWDLENKTILDVGCGLGGKLPFYIEHGAKKVVGIDLRPFSILSGNQVLIKRGVSMIELAIADGTRLPFADNTFDALISINVLEHVETPILFLSECKRVLRPGGYFYLYFPPFYSPWGAHLDGWINFPWPHLFFSERVLTRAAALIEERMRYNEQFIPSARVPWSELHELYELNRLTIYRFIKLVNEVDFKVLLFRLLPFGHHLLRKNMLGRILLTVLRAACRLPIINEVITTKVVCVLTK